MCAIAGIVGPNSSRLLVENMSDIQKHRGPDGSGIWIDHDVCLAHRRLSVIDISKAGDQPMTMANGRYKIVYNGEIYNYLELRRELGNKSFKTNSDTEVLLRAYIEWGSQCLEKLKGMYAFAIWDAQEKQLFCARDRLGIKPFYYCKKKDSFYFASEIKGLFAGGIIPTVNERIVFDFLARDIYEHSTQTFFEDIYVLPPGHWMVVTDGTIKNMTSYWDFPERVKNTEIQDNKIQRQNRLLELLDNAVVLALRADVPIAVTTSGGLDSATLLALLKHSELNSDKLAAFSFVFNDQKYSEQTYVEELSDHMSGKYYFNSLNSNDFIDSSRQLAYQLDEPFAGVPVSAYSALFKEISREGFKVVMDGTGLDEGLAGYERYVPAYWTDLYASGEHAQLRSEIRSVNTKDVSQKLQVFRSLLNARVADSDLGLAQDLTISAHRDCLNSDFIQEHECNSPKFKKPFNTNLLNLMYRELRYTKLPRALRFRDRISMARGIELRPPFLDHELLEYEFSLPASDLLSCGQHKVILRKAVTNILPESIALASKRSVQTPQSDWFRNELKDWLIDEIDCEKFWQLGWLDKEKARVDMNKFFNGSTDNSFFLWQWANMKMWVDAYL